MNTSNDQAAIKSLLFAYRDALNASSVEQVMPLYTPDGVFMPTGFPTAVGTEQVKGAYAGVFSMIKLSIEFFIHAWDFARATSQSFEASAPLTAFVAGLAEQIIQPDNRGEGKGFAAIAAPAHADAVTALMAFAGRAT